MDFGKYSTATLRIAFVNKLNDRNRALAHVATLHRWIEVTNVLADRTRDRALTEAEQVQVMNLENLRIYPCSLPAEACPSDREEIIRMLLLLSSELKGLLTDLSQLMSKFHRNLDEGQRRIVATGEL